MWHMTCLQLRLIDTPRALIFCRWNNVLESPPIRDELHLLNDD